MERTETVGETPPLSHDPLGQEADVCCAAIWKGACRAERAEGAGLWRCMDSVSDRLPSSEAHVITQLGVVCRGAHIQSRRTGRAAAVGG